MQEEDKVLCEEPSKIAAYSKRVRARVEALVTHVQQYYNLTDVLTELFNGNKRAFLRNTIYSIDGLERFLLDHDASLETNGDYIDLILYQASSTAGSERLTPNDATTKGRWLPNFFEWDHMRPTSPGEAKLPWCGLSILRVTQAVRFFPGRLNRTGLQTMLNTLFKYRTSTIESAIRACRVSGMVEVTRDGKFELTEKGKTIPRLVFTHFGIWKFCAEATAFPLKELNEIVRYNKHQQLPRLGWGFAKTFCCGGFVFGVLLARQVESAQNRELRTASNTNYDAMVAAVQSVQPDFSSSEEENVDKKEENADKKPRLIQQIFELPPERWYVNRGLSKRVNSRFLYLLNTRAVKTRLSLEAFYLEKLREANLVRDSLDLSAFAGSYFDEIRKGTAEIEFDFGSQEKYGNQGLQS
jgi:hypothetical protein